MVCASPRTQRLFLHINALLRRSPAGMTVAAIAEAVDLPIEFVATCIGLHVHLVQHGSQDIDALPVEVAESFWVPASHQVLSYPIRGPGSLDQVAHESLVNDGGAPLLTFGM